MKLTLYIFITVTLNAEFAFYLKQWSQHYKKYLHHTTIYIPASLSSFVLAKALPQADTPFTSSASRPLCKYECWNLLSQQARTFDRFSWGARSEKKWCFWSWKLQVERNTPLERKCTKLVRKDTSFGRRPSPIKRTPIYFILQNVHYLIIKLLDYIDNKIIWIHLYERVVVVY